MAQDVYDDMIRRRDDRSKSWERRTSKYRISDIDQSVFRAYLKRAKEVGRITFDNEDPESVLDKLELTNPNQQTTGTYGNTAEELEEGVIAAYNHIRMEGTYARVGYNIDVCRGDEVWNSSQVWYMPFDDLNEPITDEIGQWSWRDWYYTINVCNYVLSRVGQDYSAVSDKLKYIAGQVLFLRGLAYYNLVGYYQNPILITDYNQYSSLDGLYAANVEEGDENGWAQYDRVLDQVEEDFKQALELLPTKALGGEWAIKLTSSLDDPHAIDDIQEAWIVEIEELAAARKAEINAVKSFISRSKDTARLAYEHRSADLPRHCVFCITVNDNQFLRDQTGNRRFKILACRNDMYRTGAEFNSDTAAQIWAEVMIWYREIFANGFDEKKLELSYEINIQAEQIARQYLAVDETAEEIYSFVETPIPPQVFWQLMTRAERTKFFETKIGRAHV